MAPRKKPYNDQQRHDIAVVGECLMTPQGAEFLRWLRGRYYDRFVPVTDHIGLVAANAQRGVVADILAHLSAFNNPGTKPTTED